MTSTGTGLTDPGLVRANNEDAYLVDDELGLYVVCDGLGGHQSGEVASALAVEAIHSYLRERTEEARRIAETPGGHFQLTKLLESAAQSACQAVFRRAEGDHHLGGMGTTLTALWVTGGKGIVAHVGDSRLYLARSGKLHTLTVDHTYAAELERAGIEDRSPGGRNRHILTRALGMQESVLTDTLLFDLAAGDVCLLCTDGLANHVPDPLLLDRLTAENVQDHSHDLIELAKSDGGSDNVTVVVVRVDGEPDVEPSPRVRAVDSLSVNPVLAGLPKRVLHRLVSAGRVRRFSVEQGILDENEVRPGWVQVVSGVCKGSTSGKTFGSGDFIDTPRVTRAPRSEESIVAFEECEVLFIEREDFRALCRRYPRLGTQVLWRLIESREAGD